MKILYVLETNNNRINEVRVRMRVRWDRKLSQHLIPYAINPDKWNKETNRCVPNTTHSIYKVSASVINRTIQNYENIAEKLLRENLSVKEFKRQFNLAIGKDERTKHEPFYDVLNEYVETQSIYQGWSKNTIKKYSAFRNHLRNFNPELSMNITEKDLEGFHNYLQSPKARQLSDKSATKGFKNPTVNKYISLFRWFLRWAHKKGYYSGDLHETFKPKLKGVKDETIVFLSWVELLKLYHYEFKRESYAQVRDVFCFCSFTSLRYSDVAKLTRSDVHDNHITVVTQKTSDALVIELNDYSKEILSKYKDVPLRNNLALPVISNQKMNDYLKEIGKILEFNEPIKKVYFIGNQRYETVTPKHELLTTHCGRRTFVVNALYLGIPAEVVMKWTGHKDYEAMKPYIAIVDDLKVSEMAKFNKKSPT